IHNQPASGMEQTDTHAFRDALVREVMRRLFEESFPRIRQCLLRLTDEQIWWRPNPASNSIGNLVLHLCGNMRQWVFAGLGDGADTRRRQAEFDERGPLPRAALDLLLTDTMELVRPVIEEVRTDSLLQPRAVQTFEETRLSILIHVTEHFS